VGKGVKGKTESEWGKEDRKGDQTRARKVKDLKKLKEGYLDTRLHILQRRKEVPVPCSPAERRKKTQRRAVGKRVMGVGEYSNNKKR